MKIINSARELLSKVIAPEHYTFAPVIFLIAGLLIGLAINTSNGLMVIIQLIGAIALIRAGQALIDAIVARVVERNESLYHAKNIWKARAKSLNYAKNIWKARAIRQKKLSEDWQQTYIDHRKLTDALSNDPDTALLNKPARVGACTFVVGCKVSAVVMAAQQLYALTKTNGEPTKPLPVYIVYPSPKPHCRNECEEPGGYCPCKAEQ